MRQQAEQLLELQEIENALRDKIAGYKRIKQQLTSPSPVVAARRTLEEAESAEKAARRRQSAINDEWQGVLSKIDGEESQLYSGAVSNPKELTNLQLEVDMLKRQRATLEEQALQLIEEVDDLARTTEQARESYDSVKDEAKSEQSDLAREGNELKRQIVELKGERERLLKEIDPAMIEQYRYVQRLKNDTHAVAAMRDGICGACHVEVSAAKRDTVERVDHTTLVTCGNCGRILVN